MSSLSNEQDYGKTGSIRWLCTYTDQVGAVTPERLLLVCFLHNCPHLKDVHQLSTKTRDHYFAQWRTQGRVWFGINAKTTREVQCVAPP